MVLLAGGITVCPHQPFCVGLPYGLMQAESCHRPFLSRILHFQASVVDTGGVLSRVGSFLWLSPAGWGWSRQNSRSSKVLHVRLCLQLHPAR